MYKKTLNFTKSTDLFWNNKGSLAINYNESLSNTKLKNVDILLSDFKTGYMLGWKCNKNIQVNAEIQLKKYCISSWIDESSGTQQGKEKYMQSQDVDLIRHVFSFDKNSNLIKQKEYQYTSEEKEEILRSIERNNSNLLIDANNERFYIDIVKRKNIHCRVNGTQF